MTPGPPQTDGWLRPPFASIRHRRTQLWLPLPEVTSATTGRVSTIRVLPSYCQENEQRQTPTDGLGVHFRKAAAQRTSVAGCGQQYACCMHLRIRRLQVRILPSALKLSQVIGAHVNDQDV